MVHRKMSKLMTNDKNILRNKRLRCLALESLDERNKYRLICYRAVFEIFNDYRF